MRPLRLPRRPDRQEGLVLENHGLTAPSPPWRIVILSTVQPAVAGLDALSRAAGHQPVAIVTSQGPQGRRDESNPQRQEFFNRLVWEAPPDLDIAIAHDRSRLAPLLAAFEPDLVLCLGFPWRVPPDALAVPQLGIVNGHPSILPRYRGPAPMAWAVRNGETELGMSYHRMDEDFDTGGVLAQGSFPLGEDDWITDLQPKLGALSSQLLPRVFERLASGDPGDPQDDAQASYAGFFEDEYSAIDWSRPAAELHRQVRAWSFMFGYGQGAVAELEGCSVRIVRSRVERGPADGAPGDVLRRGGDAVLVRCGEDALWLLEIEEPAQVS
jgi:methionyl-tRNA formyltransferase